MSKVFRGLDSKSRWYKDDWCGQVDAPGDALRDLGTEKNVLSVYVFEDDEKDLERIITAVAANRENLGKVDFAVLREDLLNELDLKSQVTPGQTPDPVVNEWHRDLTELTAGKLAAFAGAICNKGKIDRYQRSKVCNLLRDAIETGSIVRAGLKSTLVEKL